MSERRFCQTELQFRTDHWTAFVLITPPTGLDANACPTLSPCPAGQIGVGESCDEMYASANATPLWLPVRPKENGTGAECGGKYQSCVCKRNINILLPTVLIRVRYRGTAAADNIPTVSVRPGLTKGQYGCAEYYPSPCSSVCKVSYSDNCDNRTEVSTPYGCAEYWEDCSSKCKVAATDNCINRTAFSTPYGCAEYWEDCSSKCQSCRHRQLYQPYRRRVPYYCEKYWDDCPSKCQIASGDNCRNRSDNSCSYGCQSPIGATVLPSARPAMPTTAGTERQFRYRPTPTARPTTPTALPNVPHGAVTLGITNPGQAAFRKRKPVPITGMKTVLKLVLV